MIVVSDASPLISLAVTGHLELLKHLYERVLIPDAVYQELTDSDAELPGAAEVQTLEWIISQPVQNEMVVRALQGELDHGEAAAIALTVELQADVVLIDERRARAVATRLGLNVVGVLGVLVEAKHKALVPRLNPILDDLITRAGFWISSQLYERPLQAVGERSLGLRPCQRAARRLMARCARAGSAGKTRSACPTVRCVLYSFR